MLETNAPAQMVAKARCRNGRNGDTLAGPGEREAAVVTRLRYASSAGRLTGPIPEQRRKPLPCEYVVATGPHRIQGRAAGAGTPVPGGPPRRLDRLRGRRPDRHGLPAGALERTHHRDLRQRRAHRLPRPPPAGPPRQRDHRGGELVGDRAVARHDRRRPAGRAAAQRARARLPLARLRRPGDRAVPPTGRDRGLRPGRVPRYLAGGSHPPAALALIRALERLAGVAIDATELEAAAKDHIEQVEQAIRERPQIAEFVEQIRTMVEQGAEQRLPSGDEIADELERFLSQQPPPDDDNRSM